MKSRPIDVSIIVMTYNHKDYIRQALDSLLEQKLDGTYEILIGDDCSTDGTSDIIREYAARYPDVIRPFIRPVNLGAKRNMYELLVSATGRYLAFLDSDDYWCDEYKLKKQMHFLDDNPEYIGCVGEFSVVNKEGVPYYDRDFQVQMTDKSTYGKEDFEKGKLASHISTLLCRNILLDYKKGFFAFWNKIDDRMAGDITMYMLLSIHGEIYCMDDKVSCYRKDNSPASTSFSSIQANNNKRDHLFITQLQLEKIAKQCFHKQVSCHRMKKNIFASAVFQWRRSRRDHDWQVILRIIRYSGQPLRYMAYLAYLLGAKAFLGLVNKEDVRVPF